MSDSQQNDVDVDVDVLLLQKILDLFVTAGYSGARSSNLSVSVTLTHDILTQGLAWCISSLAAASNSTTKSQSNELEEDIEAALRSIGCPYALQLHQIQQLDYNALYPVVQWLVNRIQTNTTMNINEVSYVMREIEREEHTVKQLEKELKDAEQSIEIVNADLNEQNLKNAHILNASQDLRVKLDKEGDKAVVERLTFLMESLKVS
ncbi:hypothetical protein AQUCO_01000657v1 [Aquilegia coerulea]|uniref:CCDC93 N-terminal domain-containing protein n=1 Tax=Aquilegia coerulea TaxID=218851 RepID=A0A2G5EB05_AQUCA|nr:hypothetical protein AQUCO_01000657v1 [Aquilegia coerulea]